MDAIEGSPRRDVRQMWRKQLVQLVPCGAGAADFFAEGADTTRARECGGKCGNGRRTRFIGSAGRAIASGWSVADRGAAGFGRAGEVEGIGQSGGVGVADGFPPAGREEAESSAGEAGYLDRYWRWIDEDPGVVFPVWVIRDGACGGC